MTATVPLPAGAAMMTLVEECDTILAAFLQKRTTSLPMKLCPWMVTLAPPRAVPCHGDSAEMVG